MHSFKLIIEKDRSELLLLLDGKPIVRREWQESRDMGRQLFRAIDDLLEKNGLKAGDIHDFDLKTRVSDNFTSVKIAQTVAAVYNWSVRVPSSQKIKRLDGNQG